MIAICYCFPYCFAGTRHCSGVHAICRSSGCTCGLWKACGCNGLWPLVPMADRVASLIPHDVTRPDDVRLSNQDRTRTSSSVTCSKAQYGTNILIRAVIIPHVASGAIPSGVPITALPSCFSFFCAWGIFSVEESACCVSTFQLLTVVATYLAQFPLFLKACVRYACGFSCFGWRFRSCSRLTHVKTGGSGARSHGV